MITNPFTYGKPIASPRRFIGRQREAQEVYSRLGNAEFESSSLVGERRIGKSSLLKYLAHRDVRSAAGFDPDKYLFVYDDLQLVDKDMTPTKLWQRLLRLLGRSCQNSQVKQALEEIGEKGSIDGSALTDIFDNVDENDLYVVFLLDEFETVTKNQNFGPDFFYILRGLASSHHLALVTSSHHDLVELTHSEVIRASPFFNIFANINLGLFCDSEAQQLISSSLAGTGISFTEVEIETLFRIAGYHPYFLQAACFYLFKAYDEKKSTEERMASLLKEFYEQAKSNLSDYWRTSDDQEKIVLTALALLERQPKVDGRAFSLKQLQDLYARSNQTLKSLEKRSLTGSKAETYSLFSTSFGDWICEELTNTMVDHQTYEEWLNSNRGTLDRLSSSVKKELTDILPKISGKYRDLIIDWVSDPRNLVAVGGAVAKLLGTVLILH